MEYLCSLREAGKKVPALDALPDLRFDESYLLEIFFLLARSRQPSFSGWLAPIIVSEIAQAYHFYGMDSLYSEVEFTRVVQLLDGAVIEHFKPKETEKDEKKPKPKKSKLTDPP